VYAVSLVSSAEMAAEFLPALSRKNRCCIFCTEPTMIDAALKIGLYGFALGAKRYAVDELGILAALS